MKKQSKILQKTSLALLMSFATSAAFAADIAGEQIAGGLYLTPTVSYDSGSLRVSSNTMDVTQAFNAGEAISFANNGLSDGKYSYELTLVSSSAAEEGAPRDESSVTQSGGFIVTNGLVEGSESDEARAQLEAAEAEALAEANAPVTQSED